MASLSTGHMATDFGQGAIPALLVFLVPELGLSNMLAGVVVMVATAASSIVQPAFGLVSDRRGATWLLPTGALLAGVGIALAAVAPSFPVLLCCVSWAGSACRLPQAQVRELRPARRAGGWRSSPSAGTSASRSARSSAGSSS
jgi:FSR family fosmidomycin resistance protein-like MFS transporter